MNIIIFCCFYFLVFHPIKTPMLFWDAERHCSQIKSEVIVPKSGEENLNIQNYMREQSIQTTWIGITKVNHPPKWIVGNKSKCDIFYYFS